VADTDWLDVLVAHPGRMAVTPHPDGWLALSTTHETVGRLDAASVVLAAIVRRQRIMGPEDVRALKRGTAILLASGARPAMLRLDSWFRQPGAAVLAAATAAAVGQISDAAERERLVGDLAADGVQLPAAPAPPILDGRHRDEPGPDTDPHRWPPEHLPPSDGGDVGGDGDPGAATPTVRPSVPRFRGPGRRL
jgi:hypothetical protein